MKPKPLSPEQLERQRIELCEQLSWVRTKKYISTDQMALLTGMLPSNIFRLEQGRRNFEINTLLRIVHALDCTITITPKNEQHERPR